MKLVFHYTCIGLFALMVLLPACPCQAGLTDQEKQLWGDSADAPLNFLIDASLQSAVMGQAQNIITHWTEIDRYMPCMNLRTITDSLIQTYSPDAIGEVGFNITCTRTASACQIVVDAYYYTGNLFSISKDSKDALKRAHLMAYILAKYASTLPVIRHVEQPKAVQSSESAPNPNVPEEISLYIKLIETQIAAKDFDAALSSAASLKMAIEKMKQQHATDKPAPATETIITTSTDSAAPPDSIVKMLTDFGVQGHVRLDLKDGTSVSGIIANINKDTYSIDTPGGTQEIAITDIVSAHRD